MFERTLLLYPRPEVGQLSNYAGQWRGLHVQIHRWIASVMQEAMNVVRTEGHGVVDSPEFGALLASLADKHQKAWQQFVEVAMTEREKEGGKKAPPVGTLARILYDVRNHAGFHYLGRELGPAYLDAFDPAKSMLKPTPPDGGRTAYYSAGDSMETTRFYYADAAVQQRVLATRPDATNQQQRADSLILQQAIVMSDALGVLIMAFLRSRAVG